MTSYDDVAFLPIWKNILHLSNLKVFLQQKFTVFAMAVKGLLTVLF
jgi:hypothetical protein